MINNDELRAELQKDEYWLETYDRLAAKPHISASDLSKLYLIRDLTREQYIDALINGTYQWSILRKILLAKQGTTKKRTVYKYNLEDRFILGVLYRALNYLCKDLISNRCFSYKKKSKYV